MEGAHPGLGFLRFVPNPDLDPERTHGWEVGSKLAYTNLLAAADTLSFKVDYFRTNISHYIDQTLVPLGSAGLLRRLSDSDRRLLLRQP